MDSRTGMREEMDSPFGVEKHVLCRIHRVSLARFRYEERQRDLVGRGGKGGGDEERKRGGGMRKFCHALR